MNRRDFLLAILGTGVAASPIGKVTAALGGGWTHTRTCARCHVNVDTDPRHRNGGVCPEAIQDLVRALEAGGYNAAPSKLVQGCTFQVEDLSPVMAAVTFEDRPAFYRSVHRKTL